MVSAVAEIAPALGNNCFSFVTDLPVLEPVAFADFIAKPTSYGIPIMVPFPNRIRDGRFRFGGAEYAIDPPRHGMVRDKTWTLVETGASDGGAWVTARIDAGDFPDEILSQFPFRFVADVTYGLTDRTLDMVTVVTNRGDSTMPLGFGIHPYFRRPERGTVMVPACSRWELEESIPTGAVVEVDQFYDLRGGRSTVGLELDDVYSELTPDDEGLVRCTIIDLDVGSRTIVEFDPFRASVHRRLHAAGAALGLVCRASDVPDRRVQPERPGDRRERDLARARRDAAIHPSYPRIDRAGSVGIERLGHRAVLRQELDTRYDADPRRATGDWNLRNSERDDRVGVLRRPETVGKLLRHHERETAIGIVPESGAGLAVLRRYRYGAGGVPRTSQRHASSERLPVVMSWARGDRIEADAAALGGA